MLVYSLSIIGDEVTHVRTQQVHTWKLKLKIQIRA